jgi:hypothetical protein
VRIAGWSSARIGLPKEEETPEKTKTAFNERKEKKEMN